MEGQLPPALAQIIEDFSYCEGQEKLEYLLELADELKPLPGWLRDDPGRMAPVPECMSPVSIYVEKRDEGLLFHFDVPRESPTVRGYAAVLQQGLDRVTPEQLSSLPPDLPLRLGLQGVLSRQRLHGITALTAKLKGFVEAGE